MLRRQKHVLSQSTTLFACTLLWVPCCSQATGLPMVLEKLEEVASDNLLSMEALLQRRRLILDSFLPWYLLRCGEFVFVFLCLLGSARVQLQRGCPAFFADLN